MTGERLTARLPDILRAAHLLIEGRLSYQECVWTHYRAMLLRLGADEGTPIFFDWPRVMDENFVFPG